jgi:hypothetical protein
MMWAGSHACQVPKYAPGTPQQCGIWRDIWPVTWKPTDSLRDREAENLAAADVAIMAAGMDAAYAAADRDRGGNCAHATDSCHPGCQDVRNGAAIVDPTDGSVLVSMPCRRHLHPLK